MKRSLFAMVFCALAVSVWAGAGAFSVEEKDGEFRVLRRGKVLLESVRAVALDDGGLGLEPKSSSATLKDGTRVWNRWSEARETRIRLEVAVKGDGSEVEITMIGECEAYALHRKRLLEIGLPWEAVSGCAFEGLLGNGRDWRPKSGVVEAETKTGAKIGGETWRYLCFKGGDAAASGVVFDFNPLGAGDYMSSYASGSIRGVFSFWRDGRQARLRGGIELTSRPGITGGKLVLREGEFAMDYPAHHAWRDFGYLHRLATQRLYSFGAAKHGKQYASAGPDYNFGINAKISDTNKLMASMIFIKWMTEKSGFAYNEGGIPIATSDSKYPAVYAAFDGIDFVADNPAKSGEEDLKGKLDADSELNINNGGNDKIQAIIEHAFYKDRSFDDIMADWNKAWSEAQSRNGVN